MISLIILLFIMLGLALVILASSKKHFWVIALLFVLFAGGLYFFTTPFSALKAWHDQGKAHYDLLVEYQKLGGLDGMIAKVKTKLKTNPNDAMGWFILGKLYLMKNDPLHAKKALQKAHQLNPDDKQIEALEKMTHAH